MKNNIAPFFRETSNNGWLSNWSRSIFQVVGRDLIVDYPKKDRILTFCNVEQFMMFCKAVCFKDFKSADKILTKSSPKEIKALGRGVRGYKDSVWAEIRYAVVLQGIELKVEQNEDIKERLLKYPKETIFAEASPYDRIWGIGLPQNHKDVYNKDRWLGTNLLGKAWSEVRKQYD